jgi:hypothetical protein
VIYTIETRVVDPVQPQPLTLYTKYRGMVIAERGDFLQDSGHTVGRGRVSTQPIFIHLQDTDMSYRFKSTKD